MTNKRPLILVNHRSPNENSGKPSGIANYMLSILTALLDRGEFDIGLVTSWRKEDLPPTIAERLHSYTFQALIRPRAIDVLVQAITMPKLARKLGADVIFNVDPIGAPRGGLVRITVVHDIYFKMLPQMFSTRERILSDFIMRLMLFSSHAVVCVSETTKNDLQIKYPSKSRKAYRIYGDAGTKFNSTPIRHQRKGHILWIGKITPNKNIDCLYQALRILADRGIFPEAVVAGSDVFGLAEKAEANYGSGLNIVRLGRVSDAELENLYAQAFCFVNTSTYEGFGMPVIEAQRLGIPVVCSTGGAVAEVAGDGALTFDPTDPATLADKLSLLIDNPELAESLIESGHANSNRFSWSLTAAEITTVVNDLLPPR